MKVGIFYIIFLSIALSACGTMGNRYSPEKLVISDTDSQQGLVILSTGASERCISTATFLNLMGGSPAIKKVSMNVDGYAVKSDFESHQGNLHALILPPGNYTLSPAIANPYVVSTKTPVFKFQLNAGERLYLGEYFMTVACALNTRSLFLDKYERDMDLLQKINPSLSVDPIEKRFPEYIGII